MRIDLANRPASLLSQVSSIGADGTRPVSGGLGTSVTPGASSTYGSFANLGVLDASNDTNWLELTVTSANVAAEARMIMLNLGIDPAGGTSFTTVWSGILVGSGSLLSQMPTVMGLPYRIPAGASVGIKAASLTATVTAILVQANAAGRAGSNGLPNGLPVGQKITTFGVTEPTVGGVAITPGTTSDGAWTEIGTLAGDEFFFTFGFQINDAVIVASALFVDLALGDGTNFRQISRDDLIITGTSESVGVRARGGYMRAKAGDKVYARAQYGAALETNNSIAVYAVS